MNEAEVVINDEGHAWDLIFLGPFAGVVPFTRCDLTSLRMPLTSVSSPLPEYSRSGTDLPGMNMPRLDRAAPASDY
jgi:hypothetical protein